MDIFSENNIRSLILILLSGGQREGVDLVDEIKKIRNGTTKQGVYKILRAMIKAKIVVKQKKYFMINQIWLTKLDKFIKKIDENYLFKKNLNKTLDTIEWLTKEGRISYVFKSYDSLDRFHSHIFSLIVKKVDGKAPLYVYNPHEWFVLKTDLKENEDYLLDWLKKMDKRLFFTIGHNTMLDKKFKEKYASKEMQITLDDKIRFPENYYLNVIGDYIIEMKNNTQLADKIHLIYKNLTDEEVASNEIKKVLKLKHKIKMIITLDPVKAKKLKTKLAKNFFIPKELRDK